MQLGANDPLRLDTIGMLFSLQTGTINISTNKQIGLYPEIKKPVFHLKEKKDITKIVYDFMLKNDDMNHINHFR